MSWRDFLVHVKAHEEWPEHIDVALRLAKQFNARLTGLRTIRDVAVLKAYLGEDADTTREVESREAEATSKAEERFRKALDENGIAGDWDIGEGDASELLMVAGRVHDLIIVEQTHEGFEEPGWDVAESCAVSSGTPTLIIPWEGSFPAIGKHILIAWNGSREAAAAVHAALPLIEQAGQVTVLIGQDKERFGSITRFPKADIVGYLGRHACRVSKWGFQASAAEAGPRMLAVAAEKGADVLVMGAYGHSSFREFILGGATRYVLKHMAIPVLMAH